MTMDLEWEQSTKVLSDCLKLEIIEEIQHHGAMSFSRYMDLALYHPRWGYYRNGSIKFGRDGDFITAPEITPLFARCLANQCEEVLTHLTDPVIVEFGAGSGRLACDLLAALADKDSVPGEYIIVELSAELRERQRVLLSQSLPDLIGRVRWVEQLPESLTGVVIANEVLDAMPVEKFVVDNVPKQMMVQAEAGELTWVEKEIVDAAILSEIERLGICSSSRYESELNRYIRGWVKALSRCLRQGVVLLIDYGFPRHEYYHPDRSMGTLMCHYRQRAFSDPLLAPGAHDITAHVDFTAVAEAASSAGLDVIGFTPQESFLLGCGLLEIMATTKDLHSSYEQAQQVKYLTLPSEMGELFKVMALGQHYAHDLSAFDCNDQTHRL